MRTGPNLRRFQWGRAPVHSPLMQRLVPFALVTVLAVTGCSGSPDADAGPVDDDTLVGAVQNWDAAVASGDAGGLHALALAIPWHVVRDCGPGLDSATRKAITGEGEAALAAIAAADDQREGALDAATIIEMYGPYLDSVRDTCL